MSQEKIFLWEDRADVCLLKVSEGTQNKNESKRPAVIICPGGGFYCMASDEAVVYGKVFEKMGFKAFVLEYSMDDKARFPQPLLDIGCAFKYIKDNSSALNIDEEQIYVYGISAGGFVATSIGLLWNSTVLLEHFKMEGEFFKPKGVFLSYPLLNMKRHLEQWGENDNLEDSYKDINLIKLINHNMPPTFIVHNQDDTVVPIESSIEFAEKLSELNVANQLNIFEKGGHSFLAKENFKNWFERLEKWL